MNDKSLEPDTTDEPLIQESVREDRFAEAALALHRARSRGDDGEIRAVLERHPDLAEELRNLLDLEAFFGLDRPGADPLSLLKGQPLSLKYDVLEEANHGAFGRVLKARDRVLGRVVAIKVFKPDLTHKSALARFIEEPQVAGQLDHPGVVPVHELGKTPDGRPYIVMKWVEGPTLHDLLHGERSPDDIPRFVEIFKQVCRTVGCAHRKWGVLHRDLKPANLMIGADGEVLVMDWGLSKVLLGSDSEPEGDARGRIETVRTLNPALATETGTRLGTVPYMSPEQAEGRNAAVDARSDVFALGAILCEILTGLSPYWTSKLLELEASPLKTADPERYDQEVRLAQADLVERVKNADLEEAWRRIDACRADPELKRLARTCLAAASKDRPADAGEVAIAVTKYLDGLYKAKASLSARLTALRSQFVAAAVLVLLLAGLIVVGLWYNSVATAAALKAVLRDEDAGKGLDEVDAALRETKWVKAQEALQRVEGRLAEGGPRPLQERVGAARKDLKFIDDWERLRTQRSHIVYGEDIDDVTVTWGYDAAFQELGIDLLSDSAAEQIKASPIREQLLGALDHWVMVEEKKYDVNGPRLLAVAQAASTSAWGRAFRDPKFRRDSLALARLTKDAPPSSPGEIESMAWALLHANGDAEPLLRDGLMAHGDDFWLNLLMALVLERKVRAAAGDEPRRRIQERAVEHLGIALAFQPESTIARTLLGGLLTDCGRYDEAVEELKRSLQTVENLERPLQPQDLIKRSLQAQDLMNTRCALARALMLRGEKDDLQQAERICNDLQPPLPARFQDLQKQIHDRRNKP